MASKKISSGCLVSHFFIFTQIHHFFPSRKVRKSKTNHDKSVQDSSPRIAPINSLYIVPIFQKMPAFGGLIFGKMHFGGRIGDVSGPWRGRIGAVSGPYRGHIGAVSGPYRDRIGAVSGPYRGQNL